MKHCNVETVLSILDIKEKSQANVREIARLTNCSKSTVADILKRCKDRGLVYTLLSQKTEEEVISLVFSPAGRKQSIAEPDWSTVFERIAKDPFLKLTDLFGEYHDKNPDGYKYSYFHEKYNTWVEKNHPECLRIPAAPVVSIDNAVGCWIGWFRNTVACLDLSGQHTYDESTDKLIVHKSDGIFREFENDFPLFLVLIVYCYMLLLGVLPHHLLHLPNVFGRDLFFQSPYNIHRFASMVIDIGSLT